MVLHVKLFYHHAFTLIVSFFFGQLEPKTKREREREREREVRLLTVILLVENGRRNCNFARLLTVILQELERNTRLIMLVEFSATSTNASMIARQILEKIPGNTDMHVSYSQDRYIFHVKRIDNLTLKSWIGVG
jgi:hypothetical protein